VVLVSRPSGSRDDGTGRETAFEPGGDFRACSCRFPTSNTRTRRVVAIGEFLDQKVRERRGRFADGEPGMTSPLDRRDARPSPPQRERGQRPGKSEPTIATSTSIFCMFLGLDSPVPWSGPGTGHRICMDT
jgi:hypothetical protein